MAGDAAVGQLAAAGDQHCIIKYCLYKYIIYIYNILYIWQVMRRSGSWLQREISIAS